MERVKINVYLTFDFSVLNVERRALSHNLTHAAIGLCDMILRH
jgi:hypothetical protein